MKLLFNSFRAHKDILDIVHNEVNPDITYEPWTDKEGSIQGYGILVGLSGHSDLLKIYDVLHFLQISVVFVNVPVTWDVDNPNGARKEPLATWKVIQHPHIMEPLDADLIMGRVLKQLGLEKISDNQPQRVGATTESTREKTKQVFIIDVYTDKHLNKPMTVLEVEAYKQSEDLNPAINIELEKILRGNPKLKYAFGTMHGVLEARTTVMREQLSYR